MSANLLNAFVAGEERPQLLGHAPAIVQLHTDIHNATRSDATVLITGETGVGKEVVARLVHEESVRRHHAFVTVNCAALPDALLESELFGHVRGSFTDAYRDKPGLAMIADRGTLFLDEVGEMSPRMQAVLLRFAETREVHRVGSDHLTVRANTRLIAATNRHLPDRIASGDFRQDLYYRFNVIQMTIPPLRERGRDIVELFMHFLRRYGRTHNIEVPTVDSAVLDTLLAYQWPGNVRELKNVVERIIVRSGGAPIGLEMLPLEVRQATNPSPQSAAPAAAVAVRPADAAWNEMVGHGKSFWTVVHPQFMDRELTKTDLRQIVRRGLEHTQGSYRKLTELFNIAPKDYKRFLAFLYQHDCHLAFHQFRESRGMTALGTRALAS